MKNGGRAYILKHISFFSLWTQIYCSPGKKQIWISYDCKTGTAETLWREAEALCALMQPKNHSDARAPWVAVFIMVAFPPWKWIKIDFIIYNSKKIQMDFFQFFFFFLNHSQAETFYAKYKPSVDFYDRDINPWIGKPEPCTVLCH